MKNGKFRWLSLILVVFLLFAGCASNSHRVQTTYFDRNGDGKVDLEKHQIHNMADGDSELRDDDYNGRYERKIMFGVGVFESKVDLPVPTNVRINKAR
jgi:hypothetical protein